MAVGPELDAAGRQRSAAFQAGDITVVCTATAGRRAPCARPLPRQARGRRRYAVLAVEDAERALRLLEEAGTPVDELVTCPDDGGTRCRTVAALPAFAAAHPDRQPDAR